MLPEIEIKRECVFFVIKIITSLQVYFSALSMCLASCELHWNFLHSSFLTTRKKYFKMFILDQTSICGTIKTLEGSCTRLVKTLPFVHLLRQRGILTGVANIDQTCFLMGTYWNGLSSQFFQSGFTGTLSMAVGHSTGALWGEMDFCTVLTLLRGKSVQRKKATKLQKKLVKYLVMIGQLCAWPLLPIAYL